MSNATTRRASMTRCPKSIGLDTRSTKPISALQTGRMALEAKCHALLVEFSFFNDPHLNISHRTDSGDAFLSDDEIRAHFADWPARQVSETEVRDELDRGPKEPTRSRASGQLDNVGINPDVRVPDDILYWVDWCICQKCLDLNKIYFMQNKDLLYESWH
jgi:hypothetical protein